MDNLNYKPNSHKYKQEQKQAKEKNVEKVVKGKVKVKKKNSLQKMTRSIIAEDAESVKSYVLIDVILPAVKKAIYDTVVGGAEMFLFGEKGYNKKSSGASKISYTNYYDGGRKSTTASRIRSGNYYDFDDIFVESRGEAEDVLNRMDELLEIYKVVSVADFYDLLGVTCDYTDNKYGWTHLKNAEIIRTRDGYKFKMPKVSPID